MYVKYVGYTGITGMFEGAKMGKASVMFGKVSVRNIGRSLI